MAMLRPDWLIEGLVDFEYKKYLLLAYLKEVTRHFEEDKLYPVLSDLVQHYRNLAAIQENRQQTVEKFPKQLTKLDLEEFKLAYERMVDDDACMDIIGQILDFAIPLIKSELGKGKTLYEQVEGQLSIEPIGIVPIDTSAGYFFLHTRSRSDALVFAYEVSLFESGDTPYRGLRTRPLEPVQLSLTGTFENHKLALIKANQTWPNPATWLVTSQEMLPIDETLLPVAKRSLVRHLAQRQDPGMPAA